MALRVLHVAGAFAQHPLYQQLIQHLAADGIEQDVFAPVRSREEADRQPPDTDITTYRYRHILKPYHRVLFSAKVRRVNKALQHEFDPTSVDIVHAHSGYSDGAVALKLSREHGLPFVVAIRNTDVNYFMRFRPDLGGQFRDITRAANKVIFLSPAYRDAFLAKLDANARETVEVKSVVIANGLDDAWFEPFERSRAEPARRNRVIYVGDFSPNKNVPTVIRAVESLRRSMPMELTLVGGGGGDESRVRRMLDDAKYHFVDYRGRINDPQNLRRIYREHDVFVMPSFRETFGVVYIEALSQGLPVVHSSGQGVDGYFAPGTVTEAVDPGSVDSVMGGVTALVQRMEDIRADCREAAARFSWRGIAKEYTTVYEDAALLPAP